MRTMSDHPDWQLPLLERMRLSGSWEGGSRGGENAGSSSFFHAHTAPTAAPLPACRSKATRLSKMEGTPTQPKHSPLRCNSTHLRNRTTGIEVLRSVNLVRWVFGSHVSTPPPPAVVKVILFSPHISLTNSLAQILSMLTITHLCTPLTIKSSLHFTHTHTHTHTHAHTHAHTLYPACASLRMHSRMRTELFHSTQNQPRRCFVELSLFLGLGCGYVVSQQFQKLRSNTPTWSVAVSVCSFTYTLLH